ncbi:zinc ribbon domain-containing protein [Streptomyces sp. NPDC005498]|uniref:zinc ribbon domain-containing protein n=1 Tax=Streptomyces sp. NPDC005498 TaxID=3364717 RepID=UPI0036D0ED98
MKLLPEAGQAAALGATLRTVNEAACWVSGVAFERGVPREYELRKHTYAELKARRLGAQAAQHVIKKTRDVYTTQCSACGHIDRRNRQSQSTFACRSCAALMHADDNASHNIGRKGETVWTAGRESRVPATP